MAVCGTYEEGGFAGAFHFEGGEGLCEFAGSEALAAFVEGDAVAIFRGGEEAFGDRFAIARFDDDEFVGTVACEPFEVVIDGGFRVGEGWFAGDDDLNSHGKNLASGGNAFQHEFMMKFVMFGSVVVIVSCASDPGPVNRQMIGLMEKFDRWDYDGSSRLNAKELKEAEELSGYRAEEIIDFYDTNRDGQISLREAQEGISRLEEAKQIVKEREG